MNSNNLLRAGCAFLGMAVCGWIVLVALGIPPFAALTEQNLDLEPTPVPANQQPTSATKAPAAPPSTTDATVKKIEEPIFGIGVILEGDAGILEMNDQTMPLINRAGFPMLGRVLKNSPADKAGLKPGDGIKSIRQSGDAEATSTKGMTRKQMTDKIRGAEGSSVILEIDGLPAPVELKREKITPKI